MAENRVVIMVQARMGSSRLPGKVMLEVNSNPIISYQLCRLRQSEFGNQIVVVTSDLPEDDVIAGYCDSIGFQVYRGHPTDLLDRHYWAAKEFYAEHIVKVPSDCPLADPNLVDLVISTHLENQFDYTSNYHPATFADGFDVEVMSFEALEDAFLNADRDWEREHTTPYIWERPTKFRIGNVENAMGNDFLNYRFTLDYQEDFEMLSQFILEHGDWMTVRYPEIIAYADSNPELKAINERYLGVNWYRHVGDELETIDSSQWRDHDD